MWHGALCIIIGCTYNKPTSTSTSYLTTDGQSASLSWNQATIWEQRILSWGHLRIFWYGMPCLTIGQVCNLLIQSVTGSWQRCHSRVQVVQNLEPYLSVQFEAGFPLCRLFRLAGLRWKYSNPPPNGASRPTLIYVRVSLRYILNLYCRSRNEM
jgi:hypothetical protein